MVVLILLILMVLAANKFIYHFETPAIADKEKFQQFLQEIAEQEIYEQKGVFGDLFIFNPNTIDSAKLVLLAVPDQVKRNLLKYRNKGGRFYSVADVRKIYGMNDSIFLSLKDYIKIKSPPVKSKFKNTSKKKLEGIQPTPANVRLAETNNFIIEVNSATATDLKKLTGIGPVLSNRIVKYRNLLGGFTNLDQLHEVYGLKSETIKNIFPYLSLDTTIIKSININFIEPAQLVKHPYVSWELVNKLVKFRSKNGFIDKIELLLKNEILNEADYVKVSPYLRTKD